MFDATAELSREPHARPRLVIAHVPSPHAPIVFAADGSPVPMSDLANFFDDTFLHRAGPRERALAAYAGQLAHIDALALAAIDQVIDAESTPPVILVLSDHGSAAGVDWDNLDASDLDERTANLFAALTPGHSGVFPTRCHPGECLRSCLRFLLRAGVRPAAEYRISLAYVAGRRGSHSSAGSGAPVTTTRGQRGGASTSLGRRLLAVPLYPAALAAAFVLGIWFQSSLDLVPLLRPLAIAIGLAAAITIIPVLLMRDKDRGGVVAGLATLGVLSGDDPRLLALSAVGVVGVLLLMTRERHFKRETSLVWPHPSAEPRDDPPGWDPRRSGRRVDPRACPPQTASAASRPSTPAAQLPDVVVLLLDAHGREDVLADQYGEDVSGFLGALRDRDFYVSPRSRSNYMNTQLTLASMFNMTHVSEMNLPPQTDPSYNVALRASLDRNRAFAALRAAGYEIGAVSPGYEGVALRSADVFLEGGQASELESVLIANSGLRHAVTALVPDALADQARERVLWNLEPDHWLPGLAPAATLSRPYFLFVHVPSPHFPFLFDRTGGPVNDRPIVVTGRGTPSRAQPGRVGCHRRPILRAAGLRGWAGDRGTRRSDRRRAA